MTGLNRKIISPKLIIAAMVAAGFVFTPALSHAGGKKHPKKAGQHEKVIVRGWNPEKKSEIEAKKKAKKEDCTAPRKDKAKNRKKGTARIELGDLPCG